LTIYDLQFGKFGAAFAARGIYELAWIGVRGAGWKAERCGGQGDLQLTIWEIRRGVRRAGIYEFWGIGVRGDFLCGQDALWC
ncbi:MAG: hypothetical protein MJ058_06345, partial [Akkermansia sp.]|nr:hypothetical protein [Akkermansia sp.]